MQGVRVYVVGLVALTACGGPSVTSTRIRGPDGTDNWVAITCPGSQMACYARAGEVCPAGYEQASSSLARGNVSGGVASSSSAHAFDGEMLIRCRGTPVVPVAPVAPHRRECRDDVECETGERCVPAPGSPVERGRCQPPEGK
jgi:hypothetical protein